MENPACNLPWIDTVVNSYAGNSTYSNPVSFTHCCPTPGNCGLYPATGGCTGGVIECTVGNSRFACRHTQNFKTDTACYQEGTLAATRNIPCCTPALPGFLKTQTCMSGFARGPKTWVCCKDRNDAGSCLWAMTCFGYPSFFGIGGKESGLFYGFIPAGEATTGSKYCVHEVALGKEVESGGCLAMSPPQSGCALGGSGPPAPFPVQTSSSSIRPTQGAPADTKTVIGPVPTGTRPSEASTLRRANRMVVWLLAPLLLQLLMR
ncbi:hypothetical protein BGZ67_005189 [Mortierella alpina]|nr:hypothetical protein BGZ67_005189 [Mortierella alpina]